MKKTIKLSFLFSILFSFQSNATAGAYIFCTEAPTEETTYGKNRKWAKKEFIINSIGRAQGQYESLPYPLESKKDKLWINGKRDDIFYRKTDTLRQKVRRAFVPEQSITYLSYNLVPDAFFNDEKEADAFCQIIVNKCKSDFGVNYTGVGVSKGDSFKKYEWGNILMFIRNSVTGAIKTAKYCNSSKYSKYMQPILYEYEGDFNLFKQAEHTADTVQLQL
ncbi:hypothetical protein [Fluviispira vulneris]|uniref:hypothetical protein n=1 Tax=Fluviispira vulneris TaxID=2763012 RepID=UPI00164866D7|nr:hypothetical protein [Fluviispira vulneris]